VILTDTVRFRLSDAQIAEISATGEVSLGDVQLKILRRIYPKFPGKVPVASITFNDSLEREESCVDVVWSSADEIAVIVRETLVGSEEEILVPKLSESLLRLGPKGTLHLRGRRATLDEALAFIAEVSAASKEHASGIFVTVPPPYRTQDGWVETDVQNDPSSPDKIQGTQACNERVKALLATLTTFAHARNLLLWPGW
jgi:hypothetical protein